MARQRHVGAFVFGAVLGGIAGAAYGLFTAPQAGAVTRQRLMAQARGVVQQAEQVLAALADESGRLVESGRAAILTATGRVKQPKEAAVPVAPPAEVSPPTDEVIASAPVPSAAPATDEVIEGPRPAMTPPPQPAASDGSAGRDTASGGRL